VTLLATELESVLKLLPWRCPKLDEYRFDMGGAMGTAGVVDDDDDDGTAVGDELVPPPDGGDLGEPGSERGRGGYCEAADEVFERLMGIGCCCC